MTRIAPFLISFTVTCVFFIDFCAWVFGCGCTHLWAGADALCNIHAAHGHHCPWCSHGYAGYAIAMAGMCAPQLAVAMLPRWNFLTRTLAAVAMFPVAGYLTARLFALVDLY